MLTSEIVMAYSKGTGILILDTDASGTSIGATFFSNAILWTSETEKERPILHASKSLTKAQRKYYVTRKELLATVYFVQYFRLIY